MKVLALFCMASAMVAETSPTPVARELLELRLELYRQGIDFQDWKIWRLESELEQAHGEQRRVEQQERALAGELTSAEGESSEGEGRKAEVSQSELPRLREVRRWNDQRVAELGSLLAKERQRRLLLTQLADKASARLRELDRVVH